MSPLRGAGVAALLVVLLSGCGGSASSSDGEGGPGEREAEAALTEGADRTVCSAEAEPVADPAEGLPTGWSFPLDTTVYDVEDRSGVGRIVTAVSRSSFDAVLDHLNHAERGVEVTSGETEEHDAEADWTADGFSGRWTIRTSATCPGEILIQVLSTPAG